MVDTTSAPAGPTLLLITSFFPFESGEEFIEGEIGRLAAEFSEVLIAPLSYRSGMTQTRDLPANVGVLRIPPRHRSGSDAADAIRFAARHPWRALRSLSRAVADGGLRPSRTWANLQFDLLSSLLASELAQLLPEGFLRSQDAVIYSYWMHTQARTAVELRGLIRRPKIPLVTRGHGGDIYTEAHRSGFLPQRARIAAAMARIYPVSRNGADYLRRCFPSARNRISPRRLGVAAAHNPGNPQQAAQLVITCSWVRPLKRLDLFVDALALTQQSFPQARWVHFGGGPAEAMAALHDLATEQLAPGSFEFAGALTNSELRARYGAQPATVFVNVSETEGVPVSIMEALAQGLPVIATDVGGSAELIDADAGMFDGLLPARPSTRIVADRLETLLSSPPERFADYVSASLTHWQSEWSSETNYTAFARELASLSRGSADTGITTYDANAPAAELRPAVAPPVLPHCSVVIPCYNGEQTLPRQLDALLRQDPEVVREIIVADNMSTDGTKEVVASYAARDPRVKYRHSDRGQGPVFAQNDGVRASTQPFVMLCGADDEVQPGWAEGFAAEFRAGAKIVGCTIVRTAENGETLEEISQLSDASWPGYLTLGGGQAGFARHVFDELDGLDESFAGAAEDVDFFWRAQLAGYGISFAPDARFNYYSRPTGSEVLAQRRGWGRSRAQLYAKYRSLGMPRRSRFLAIPMIPWCLLRLALAGTNEHRRTQALAGLGTNIGVLEGSLKYRCWYL